MPQLKALTIISAVGLLLSLSAGPGPDSSHIPRGPDSAGTYEDESAARAAVSRAWTAAGIGPALNVAFAEEKDPLSGARFTPERLEELEQFRAQLDDFVGDLQRLYPFVSQYSNAGLHEKLDDAELLLDDLSPEELSAIEGTLSEDPVWWDVPQYLLSLYDPNEPRPARFGEVLAHPFPEYGADLEAVPTPDNTPDAPLPTREPFPSPRAPKDSVPDRPGCIGAFGAATCDECPPNIPTGTIRDIFIVDALSLNAQAFDSGVDGDVDVCVFPGVASSVPNPLKPFSLGVSLALQATVLGLQATYGVNDACEQSYHRWLTDRFLDDTVSSRVTQASLDARATFDLKVRIEDNLLRDQGDRISLFQLPESICGAADPQGFQYCGLLETVREIVRDAIQQNQAVGMLTQQETDAALAELAAGDAHYDLSQWKSAYERYSRGYRIAVAQSGGAR